MKQFTALIMCVAFICTMSMSATSAPSVFNSKSSVSPVGWHIDHVVTAVVYYDVTCYTMGCRVVINQHEDIPSKPVGDLAPEVNYLKQRFVSHDKKRNRYMRQKYGDMAKQQFRLATSIVTALPEAPDIDNDQATLNWASRVKLDT